MSHRNGLWIPKWIEDLRLTNSQTRLFAEIVNLAERGKCFASNKYFAEILGLKVDTVSGLISQLKKRGLIAQTGFDGRRRYLAPLVQNPAIISAPVVSIVSVPDNAPAFSASAPNPSLHRIPGFNSDPYPFQAGSGTPNKPESDSDSRRGPCTLKIKNKIKPKIYRWEEFLEFGEKLSKETREKIRQSNPESFQPGIQFLYERFLQSKGSLDPVFK